MKKAQIKFGTSGWRAIIADEFTFENVDRVIDSIVLYLRSRNFQNKKIIIGSDARFLSEQFRKKAAERFNMHGIDVLLTESMCPTPVISFAIREFGLAGGINFTASHNPPEYQGIKFSPETGAPADSSITKFIEEHLDLPVPQIGQQGKTELFDPKSAYFSELNQFINFDVIKSAKLKIAVDVLYGKGHGYLDVLLKNNGAEVVELHGYNNPGFGGKRPEPAPENLEDLLELMRTGNFDLGLSTDGDADRFGIIDRDGTFYYANQVLAMTAWHLFKNKKVEGRVVRSVASSCLLDRVAKHFGKETVEVPVGFKYIGPLVLEGNFAVGGEESGGLTIGGHIPEKDGILACLLIAELVATEKKSLREIWNDIVKTVGDVYTDRVDLSLTLENKEGFLAEVKVNTTSFLSRKICSINAVDGSKFTFEDGSWLLIRPSGTEPIIRCYFEAETRIVGEKLKQDLLIFSKKWL